MHKAPGISYEQILKNTLISDKRKIELHKKVLDKVYELGQKYYIYHKDALSRPIPIPRPIPRPRPRHVLLMILIM